VLLRVAGEEQQREQNWSSHGRLAHHKDTKITKSLCVLCVFVVNNPAP
jgi:hypothetical protein